MQGKIVVTDEGYLVELTVCDLVVDQAGPFTDEEDAELAMDRILRTAS